VLVATYQVHEKALLGMLQKEKKIEEEFLIFAWALSFFFFETRLLPNSIFRKRNCLGVI